MTTAITIDCQELRVAAPAVAGMYTVLYSVGRSLADVAIPEMPGGLAAQVTIEISDIDRQLTATAAAIDGTAEELLRRAGLAELADQVRKVPLLLTVPSLKASLIHRAHEMDVAASGKHSFGVPDNVDRIAVNAAKLFKGVNLAASKGATVLDWLDPNLDLDTKIARTVAASTTGSATAGASKWLMAAKGLRAVTAATGAGLVFTLVDYKFHVTDSLAEELEKEIGKVGDGLDGLKDRFGHEIGKAFSGIHL